MAGYTNNHWLWSTYLTDDLKRDRGMMVFQRRDVIVANGKLCLCIDLVTIDKVKDCSK